MIEQAAIKVFWADHDIAILVSTSICKHKNFSDLYAVKKSQMALL